MQQQAVLLACSTESNITAWDLATATQLTQYKGNASGRGRVTRLGSDYLAAAQNSKDAIHFWTWHKDQVLQRCFTQEPLTALAASPNGAYLVGGGASGTLYCWEAFSGRLLRSWPAHYKAVSCLAFSDSGGLLVSAGEDTLVAAWLLAEVLDEQRDGPAAAAAAVGMARVEPLHTWSEHTLPVTCIYLGCGEGSALLATASLDRSVKLWSLTTGQLLRTITLPAGVTSVTLDAGEHVLLAGCVDGSIWEAPLAGQQLAAPAAAAAAAGGSGAAAAASDAAAAAAAAAGVVGGPGSCCYEGHSKAISSLEITPDGEQLVSGSEDGTARIWDLRSRQCLRSIASPNKAPVTAALLMAWPGHLGPAGSAGRQGPKRLQPLAALAKFAGAAGTSKPWEGALTVLDGSLCSNSSSSCSNAASTAAAVAGLLPGPLANPLDLLQLQGSVAAPAAANGGLINQQQQGSGQGSGQQQQQQDVAQLQQQVEQLQQQLQESRQVSGQWQALHGELHQFCTDKVLAAGLDA
uniref:Uncharacterized protein n=1 Tax=Tetradesmus obliquus TaxID=3088 RepID=A0A383WA77_TETOB|eukprot:jgi/Sobl393_1/2811/SZX73894.1